MYLGSKRMKKEETKRCLEMCLLAKHIFYSEQQRITLVFDCLTYEEQFPTQNIWKPNTQSHGIKKIKIDNEQIK